MNKSLFSGMFRKKKKVIECPDCKSTNIGGAPEGFDFSSINSLDVIYECHNCKAIIRWYETSYGPALKILTPGRKKTPFAEEDKKDVEEMLVAVALLMEHPNAVDYVKQLEKDLKVALGATNG